MERSRLYYSVYVTSVVHVQYKFDMQVSKLATKSIGLNGLCNTYIRHVLEHCIHPDHIPSKCFVLFLATIITIVLVWVGKKPVVKLNSCWEFLLLSVRFTSLGHRNDTTLFRHSTCDTYVSC